MAEPIEVTTRYATTVDDLTAAWAFVMERLDRDDVGPDPSITISPVWTVSVHDMESYDDRPYPRRFSVVVDGMVHEPSPDTAADRSET